MSIVDEINANTAYVASAKLALERTLREKGVQVTADNTSFPTFDQLNTAIAGMQAVAEVSGVEDVAVLANEDIPKGAVCSLTQAKGNFQAIQAKPPIPTTGYRNDNTMVSLDTRGYSGGAYANTVVAGQGKLLLIPATSYSNYFLFYLLDGEYVQLKIGGNYTNSDLSVNSSDYRRECYAFDEVTKRFFFTYARTLYVYKLDEPNLNFVFEYSESVSGSYNYVAQTLYAYNNNLIWNLYSDLSNYIYTRLSKYDPTVPSLTTIGNINAGYSTSSYVSNAVLDMTTDIGTGTMYCVVAKHNMQSDTCEVRVQKLTYNETSGQYLIGTYTSGISTKYIDGNRSRVSGYGYKSPAQISLSGELFYTIDINNKLHMYQLNTSSMTLTEAPLIFKDNLDYSKIEAFALVKGANYLYVLSTDTDLAANERLRLYKYSPDVSGWVFVCCPAKDTFQPLLDASTVPAISSLISGKKTLAKSADGSYRLYDVGEAKLGFDYYANNAYNKLILGATDYGIASRAIKAGEVDNMSHILSGQSDVMVSAINASIEESIGGAY